LESLINVDFGREYELQTKIAKMTKNDHASFDQTNELIGYQNSADFCEIWPEYFLDVVKQKCVGDF